MYGFLDRTDAGRALARSLLHYRDRSDVIVLGLARGGIPVAYEVARMLRLPLDVMGVRKLGLPSQPEVAMGALASGGAIVLNEDVLRFLPDRETRLPAVRERESLELARREYCYRGGLGALTLSGLTVLLVDDGLATGATMAAAVQSARVLGAHRVVVAVPVASAAARARIAQLADEMLCLHTPSGFSAVGEWYRQFDQVDDQTVTDLLRAATVQRSSAAPVTAVRAP